MTTLLAGTRGDGIRVRSSGADVRHLAAVGALRGVTPLAAAARCGPGAGLLTFSPSPRTLSWQAPGSSSPGTPITIPTDGTFLLEDGADQSKWLRVSVATAWLPSSAAQANVFLDDRWNEVGPVDVTAVEASAGLVETFQLDLVNVSPANVLNVKAWLDPSTSGLAISTDNSTWKTPTSETDAAVLSWASIGSGASVPLYVRRTTLAGASPSPARLNLLQLGWDGL